jgi:Ca-activated chloride channel family protein
VTQRQRAGAIASILMAARGAALGQGGPPEPAPAPPPALEILAPTRADMPTGETTIRVLPKNLQPGDILDFFVDGRKVGAVTAPPWEIVWKADETLRRHVITVALLRNGREVATARVNTRDAGFTARAGTAAVGLAPIVTDRSGRYLLGLSQADFTVSDDGRPQRIETFETVDSPLAAILVLDISASMQPKIDDATRAARAFVKALKPDDRVGLYTFNTGLVGSVDLTLDRKPVIAGIDAARTDGETALYDAIAAALRRLKPVRQRKAVVVFTDGEDNRSRFSLKQVIEMAQASEVSVYAVAEAAETSVLYQFLQRLANETGGRSYPIAHIRKLPGTFTAIVTELRSQYFLTYTPSNRKPRSWHTIDVRVNRPGAVVRAKKKYFVP